MKRRYMLSLTKERVDRFHLLSKDFGLPPSTMSRAVDDFLADIVGVMEKARAKGSYTFRDVFTFMGEQLELITEGGESSEKSSGVAASKEDRPQV